MDPHTISFELLLAGQVVGTLVFAVGLFLGGLTPVTVAGGALILLSIVGLALAAFGDEARDVSAERGGREPVRSRLPFGLGRGSK
ncbi:hypothetical protein [Natronolimnohabitans innermongolicus]|uniref:Uncharacterized protein n=1 Tax=Natronolimnohabitans innermongolicus JCM 12255 TaxID=1227499 RepID=L9WXY5_9EURY|nr:hypothetical protein [Natronolimnohabitans innermongolicus]ELY54282.1 hypothetical protein C493_12784 [Natronolimnohabitans innermongolicus JCM 12255]